MFWSNDHGTAGFCSDASGGKRWRVTFKNQHKESSCRGDELLIPHIVGFGIRCSIHLKGISSCWNRRAMVIHQKPWSLVRALMKTPLVSVSKRSKNRGYPPDRCGKPTTCRSFLRFSTSMLVYRYTNQWPDLPTRSVPLSQDSDDISPPSTCPQLFLSSIQQPGGRDHWLRIDGRFKKKGDIMAILCYIRILSQNPGK